MKRKHKDTPPPVAVERLAPTSRDAAELMAPDDYWTPELHELTPEPGPSEPERGGLGQFRWENPPPPVWLLEVELALDLCHEQPGRWAHVMGWPKATKAKRVKRELKRTYPELLRGVDVRTVNDGPAGSRLYLRARRG